MTLIIKFFYLGEYEGLKEKIRDPKMQPDFGPSLFRSRYGASCVGARNFLIAYSVNIQGSKEQAHEIVLQIKNQNVTGESVKLFFSKYLKS
jgi:glutamate formiminotransferase / formiminotetrahydrofolate cyclodeaminase